MADSQSQICQPVWPFCNRRKEIFITFCVCNFGPNKNAIVIILWLYTTVIWNMKSLRAMRQSIRNDTHTQYITTHEKDVHALEQHDSYHNGKQRQKKNNGKLIWKQQYQNHFRECIKTDAIGWPNQNKQPKIGVFVKFPIFCLALKTLQSETLKMVRKSLLFNLVKKTTAHWTGIWGSFLISEQHISPCSFFRLLLNISVVLFLQWPRESCFMSLFSQWLIV